MQIKNFLLLLALNSLNLNAQKITPQDVIFLDNTIENYLHASDTLSERQSEIAILIFNINSQGYVNSINLLSDRKNETEITRLLRILSPQHFRRCFDFRNGQIIFPIITIETTESNNYADTLFQNYLREAQRPREAATGNKSVTIIRPYVYIPKRAKTH